MIFSCAVASVFPSVDALAIEPDENSVQISWNLSSSGWMGDYSVKYLSSRESMDPKNQFRSLSFVAPPG